MCLLALPGERSKRDSRIFAEAAVSGRIVRNACCATKSPCIAMVCFFESKRIVLASSEISRNFRVEAVCVARHHREAIARPAGTATPEANFRLVSERAEPTIVGGVRGSGGQYHEHRSGPFGGVWVVKPSLRSQGYRRLCSSGESSHRVVTPRRSSFFQRRRIVV